MAFTDDIENSLYDHIRGCVLNSDGSLNYYLKNDDWTEKADGTASDLTGGDGNVMVQIPKFYYKQEFVGSVRQYSISATDISGYTLHPAFDKNGTEEDYRYISAYDACVYSDSASDYIGGLNLDDNTGNVNLSLDKLASVKGQYPMVGLTRDEFRQLADNNGTGWRVGDFWLVSAIQMLYLVEYQDWNSQDNLGDGNTNGSYVGSSSNQTDSPHTIAGAGDSWANGSTDGTQPSSGANPGTAYMKYRGIENFFGNCTNWVDGVNISSGSSGDWHVSNTDTDFDDDTTTNYDLLVNSMPSDGYVTDVANASGAFIPSSTGGSSSTFISDQFFDDNGNSDRVARFGGSAGSGARGGAFGWSVGNGSGNRFRSVGARLAF